MAPDNDSKAEDKACNAGIDACTVVEESLKIACDALEKAVVTKKEQRINSAVDKLYKLFTDSNSTSTGIPTVLRFIEPYINTLLDFYEASRNKKLGAIVLKLLLIYKVDSPDFISLFGCIYYETHEVSVATWPIEFLRSAANYFARFYGEHIHSAGSSGELSIPALSNYINDLRINGETAYNILIEDAKALLTKDMQPEAIDCLIEAKLLNNVKALGELVTKQNVRGLGEYIYQCAVYDDPQARNPVILALAQLYIDLDMLCDAFVLVLSLCYFSYAKTIICKATQYNRLLQMAYLIAYNGSCGHFSRDDFVAALAANPALSDDMESLNRQADELWKVACNGYTHSHLLSLVDELELNVPRSIADILKADQLSIRWNTLDPGYVCIGDYLMNAFANAGMGSDKLLESHKTHVQKQRKQKNSSTGIDEDIIVPAPSEMDISLHPDSAATTGDRKSENALAPEGSRLMETSGPLALLLQALGTASLGVIYAYHGNGYGQAFNVISRYFSSPSHWIRTGAALALGISSANTIDVTGINPALRMLGGVFNLFYVNTNEPFKFTEYFPYSCAVFQKQIMETQNETGASADDSQSTHFVLDMLEQHTSAQTNTNDFSIEVSDQSASTTKLEATVQDPQPRGDRPGNAQVSPDAAQQAKQNFIDNFKRILNNSHKQRLYDVVPHKHFMSVIKSIEIKEEHEYINLSQAYAALGIGIACAGTSNQLATGILVQRLCLSSTNVCRYVPILEKNPRATACLALGLVLASTANLDAAYFILRVMAGNTKTQRLLRFFPLKPIGLGCIFLRSGSSPEGQQRIKSFCDGMYPRLLQIKIPDSKQERSKVPVDEEQLHLAAYIQSVVMVCGYAFTGNVTVISELMQGIYEVISGRVAAEETISLNELKPDTDEKPQNHNQPDTRSGSTSVRFEQPAPGSSSFAHSRGRSSDQRRSNGKPPRSLAEAGGYKDKDRSGKGQGGRYDMSAFAADSGVPLQMPNDDVILWPGENLDPVSILVAGLGLVAGNDPVCSMMVNRYINKVMQYGNSYARRACPLALALMNLSRPTPELTDTLFRMASQSDENLSINAIIALGLVGCGSCNARIAQSLRQLADSKYFNTRPTDASGDLTNVLLAAIKLSLGLVHCGRGLMHINVVHNHGKVVSNPRLACLTSLVLMLASNARVMMRPKFIVYFFLLAGALRPKYLVSVDAANKRQSNPFKIGSYLDTVSLPEPFRLTGYQSNTTPMILSQTERALPANDNIVPMVTIIEDVVVTTQTVAVDMTVD